jgi:pre-rRNA-processing protein IPI3
MIHVWALPSILSFAPDTSRSPVHTLSTHRGPITAIVCGHSSSTSNIAVSLSEDKSAIVWNYHNGQALRTYLLPERPQALALDPADRAVYVGYGDGSLQTLNFYDEVQALTATDTLRDTSLSHRPVQPSKGTRFSAESQKLGAALSLSLSWDGTSLISGHASGKVAVWDAAKRIWMSIITSLPGPVSNLQFLEPTGFPKAREPTFKVHSVIKPKQDAGLTGGDALVPANYSLTMQFVGRLPSRSPSATEGGAASRSEFEEALTHPSFPQAMLDEGLAELATWNPPSKSVGVAPAADFMSLSESGTAQDTGALTGDAQSQELQQLKNQLASLQRVQKVTFKQLSDLREEKEYFVAREQKRAQRAHSKAKKASKPANGARNTDDDVEMSEVASASSASGESESSGHSDEEGSASSDEASSASPSE